MAEPILGLDLGQAADYSAMAILERIASTDSAASKTRYACLGLRRWPLGTPYPVVIEELIALLQRPPLGAGTLVVDATGVGRPIVDLLRQAGLCASLVPVTITGGRRERLCDGFHHVPKRSLILGLRQVLQQRRLLFAQELAEVPALVRELKSHRISVTPGLHESFGACAGAHDDLVLALALAVWHGERAGK